MHRPTTSMRRGARLLVVFTVATVATFAVTPAANGPAPAPDPELTRQWHLGIIGVPAAWERSTGSGVVVAVLDSGITPGPDLSCRRFVAEYDAVTRSQVPVTDVSGHGTHVAGTIAECSRNGVAGAGVAPDAFLMDVRILGSATGGGGEGSYEDLAAAIRFAVAHGASVINMSVSAGCDVATPTYASGCRDADVDAAIADAVAHDIVLVAAAGNDATDRLSYPANHPDVIAVSAVDGSLNSPAYGTTGDQIDLSAPGGANVDTDSDGSLDHVMQESYDPTTATWSLTGLYGSSHAAAHVTGVVALLRSADPAATAVDVRRILIDSSCDLGEPGDDPLFGAGLLQAGRALELLLDGAPASQCAILGGGTRTQ
ncbi:MAG: serine protease [Nitriliruptoraceae bacterium]|jgi:serine protease